MAILSMNFSNGAWACLDAFFYNLVSSVCTITSSSPALTTANYYIVAVVIFAVSQFIFAVLCVLLPPRLVLLLAYAGSITFSALIMGLDLHSANGTVSMVLVLTIFEAPMFPLIFAIGLRGLGRWTKLGAWLITSGSALGACIFPSVMLAVLAGPPCPIPLCVVVALFAAVPQPVPRRATPGRRSGTDHDLDLAHLSNSLALENAETKS